MEVIGHFQCRSCENNCEIKRIRIKDKIYPFGGLCSKFANERKKNVDINEGVNLVDLRNKIMFEEFCPDKIENPRGTIGLPLVLSTYELFPFFAKLITSFISLLLISL